MKVDGIQQVWEDHYSKGNFLNKYPFDSIVTFVFRNFPRDKEKSEIKILEVGCGSGNNLWFAAREGFDVYGIDGSESAIEYAKNRFMNDGLKGEFKAGNFLELNYPDGMFDIILDRAALTCCTFDVLQNGFTEIQRVLKPGGKFFFNPYSDRHTSFIGGDIVDNGITTNIEFGTLTGIGDIYFYSKREILKLFSDIWEIETLEHSEQRDELNVKSTTHSEWRVVAKKK